MLQKKKRFSVSTLLKTRLRCGRRHFFATRVDLKKEAADFANLYVHFFVGESALPVPTGGEFTKKADGFLVTKTWPTTGASSKKKKNVPTFFWKAIFGRQDRNFCSRSTAPTSEVLSKASSTWTRVLPRKLLQNFFQGHSLLLQFGILLGFHLAARLKTLPLAQQWAPIRLLEMPRFFTWSWFRTRSICFGLEVEGPWPGFSLLGSQTS